MDWEPAIRRNRDALLAVVASLRAMAAQAGGNALPRLVVLAILRILRPAELAARRLIVIVAAALKQRNRSALKPGRPLPDFSRLHAGTSDRPPVFPLFDQPWSLTAHRKRRGSGGVPRLWMPGMDTPSGLHPATACPQARPEAGAAPLRRRIAALQHALETLPMQARRLQRLMRQRDRAVEKKAKAGRLPGTAANPLPLGPLRPGRPPGHRERARNEADHILKACQSLANWRLGERRPDAPP